MTEYFPQHYRFFFSFVCQSVARSIFFLQLRFKKKKNTEITSTSSRRTVNFNQRRCNEPLPEMRLFLRGVKSCENSLGFQGREREKKKWYPGLQNPHCVLLQIAPPIKELNCRNSPPPKKTWSPPVFRVKTAILHFFTIFTILSLVY